MAVVAQGVGSDECGSTGDHYQLACPERHTAEYQQHRTEAGQCAVAPAQATSVTSTEFGTSCGMVIDGLLALMKPWSPGRFPFILYHLKIPQHTLLQDSQVSCIALYIPL